MTWSTWADFWSTFVVQRLHAGHRCEQRLAQRWRGPWITSYRAYLAIGDAWTGLTTAESQYDVQRGVTWGVTGICALFCYTASLFLLSPSFALLPRRLVYLREHGAQQPLPPPTHRSTALPISQSRSGCRRSERKVHPSRLPPPQEQALRPPHPHRPPQSVPVVSRAQRTVDPVHIPRCCASLSSLGTPVVNVYSQSSTIARAYALALVVPPACTFSH